MPGPEARDLPHAAVLQRVGPSDRYGQPTVLPPEEIAVRWNTRRNLQLEAKGQKVSLDATAVVAVEIAVGSRMWLGTLEAWNAAAVRTEVMEVKSYTETWDVKGRYATRTVGMLKAKDG